MALLGGARARVGAAVQHRRGCAESEVRDNDGLETVAAAVRRSGMGGLQRLGHGWRGGGGYGNHGG